MDVPRWEEVVKRPIKFFLNAREYHTATCRYLLEVRVSLCMVSRIHSNEPLDADVGMQTTSVRATIDAARAAAAANWRVSSTSAEEDVGIPTSPTIAPIDVEGNESGAVFLSSGSSHDNPSPCEY